MKILILIASFMFLMASCNSSDEERTTLLNTPTGNVKLTLPNEEFTVDFTFGASCIAYTNGEILKDVFSELKTRDDLIDYYKTLRPAFLPIYSSMWPDNREYIFVRIEYTLAQECFSDRCSSNIRKEILQLVTNYQKDKYQEYTHPACTQKSGVFLMAVILAKERNSTVKIIDTVTLQQALLCLNSENSVNEDFSRLIIECSEAFLTNSK